MRPMRHYVYDAISSLIAWRYRLMGMTIGEGCKISRHAKIDLTNPKGVAIGRYTAITFDAAILTHDFIKGQHKAVTIGSYCFIGARSVIMPGVTIGDHAIIGTGSIVLTDVPPKCVVVGNPARVVETGIVTGRWGIRNEAFLAAGATASGSEPSESPRDAGPHAGPAALPSYFPAVRDYSSRFDELGFDSFALIVLRAEIEENEDRQISDEDWVKVECPADLSQYLTKARSSVNRQVTAATAQRLVPINMPQMAMSGLSESWLFKEVGDIHWAILASSLGVSSRSIVDQAGDRLYATFTRIMYKSNVALAEYCENDNLVLSAAMTRFGAGMFFSSIQGKSESGHFGFEIMSSFSKFGEKSDNISLVKGQPSITANFIIPSVSPIPQFATDYREIRSSAMGDSIFTTVYELVPNHDINGVGLLYFAAYPTIVDICLSRFFAPKKRWSVIERDCCYFANTDPSDPIRFDLVQFDDRGGEATATASLTRPDGTRLALIRTRFQWR